MAATLIGAFVVDSYWGNYSTLVPSLIIFFIGSVVLTLSTSLSILKHSPIASFLGLYMIAFGAGATKLCLSAFGADQFDTADTAAKGSFFSLYYLTITIGDFFAGTVVVWIQDNYGWTSATRKFNLDLPEDESLLHNATENSAIDKLGSTPEFSFFNKASIVSASDFTPAGARKPWSLCTRSQVEELKSILRLFPIWTTFILFASVNTQESTVFVEQGMFMNTRLGSMNIPPASLTTFAVLAVIAFTPFYDNIIVLIARRFTGQDRGLPPLQRTVIGLFFAVLAMVSAAIVETKRLEIASKEGLVHEKVAVSMSILWQIPQHVLVGVGEVFNQIGLLEFFYDQASDSMRSLYLALALLTIALGGCHLDYFDND